MMKERFNVDATYSGTENVYYGILSVTKFVTSSKVDVWVGVERAHIEAVKADDGEEPKFNYYWLSSGDNKNVEVIMKGVKDIERLSFNNGILMRIPVNKKRFIMYPPDKEWCIIYESNGKMKCYNKKDVEYIKAMERHITF